jgi:hypothetical protein
MLKGIFHIERWTSPFQILRMVRVNFPIEVIHNKELRDSNTAASLPSASWIVPHSKTTS